MTSIVLPAEVGWSIMDLKEILVITSQVWLGVFSQKKKSVAWGECVRSHVMSLVFKNYSTNKIRLSVGKIKNQHVISKKIWKRKKYMSIEQRTMQLPITKWADKIFPIW